jgi:type I restriction enzyme, S subunit
VSVETLSIEDATERLIDYRGKTPPKVAYGVRLVTAKVIKDGRILDDPAEYIAADFYDEWMRRGLPQAGDVLVTTEAPLGEVAILGRSKVALAQRVILLRARSERVLPRFLYYALQSEFAQAELRRRATGTTVAGIKQSELRQARIPWFPLETQRRVIRALTAYDDLIENNLRRMQILEEMARILHREWFAALRAPRVADAGHVGLPVGWRRVPLREVVDVNPKVVVPRDSEKPFVPMGCLSNDSMIIDGIESRGGNSGSKFQNGDTLFARITPCLENGKTAFVQFLPDAESVGFGSTEFIVLRSKALTPEFVYLMARSDEVRGPAIKSMSGASGRQRVQEQCFDTMTVVQPPPDVLGWFTEIVRPMFQLVHQLHLQNVTLRRTRDLLLPRLMSGQLALADIDSQSLASARPQGAAR